MKTLLLLLSIGLMALSPMSWAQESIHLEQNDNQTGNATRALLTEQREGVNRGKIEPYKAESAGKAYQAYTDSIGKPTEQMKSQLDTAK